MAGVLKFSQIVWLLASLSLIALGCGDDDDGTGGPDDDAGLDGGGSQTAGRGGTGGRSGAGGAGSGGQGGSSGRGGNDAGGPASCDDLDCDAPATCDDSGADARCVCPDGYEDSEGDGSQCDDIDECDDPELNDCADQAVCTNTAGGFDCECPEPAYTGNGESCDCADGYTEVDDACVAEDGTACDEDDDCENAHCVSGVCCATACDTSEACAVAEGATCADGATCVYPDAADASACDDGDPCTVDDQCSAGSCEAGDPKDCSSAANTCNTGMCEAGTGNCIPVPLTESVICNDGNLCTENDQCDDGACVSGAAKDCTSASNTCNVGICNQGTGNCEAMPSNQGGNCDDNNACTTTDQCQTGNCVGTNVDCDDDNLCTTDTCVPATGCAHDGAGVMTTNCLPETPCDTYRCRGDAAGSCDAQPKQDCSDLDDECNAGMCDPVSGDCEAVPANQGGTCDDDNACTSGETCNAGDCSGGTTVTCNDNNPCTDDSCNQQLGCQVQNNTAVCSDNNPCTTDDHCLGGGCTDTEPVDCSSMNNQCNVGMCNTVSGACEAQPTNPGGACNDANSCTTASMCTTGACIGSGNACGANSTACTPGTPNTCTCAAGFEDNGAGQCVPANVDECDANPCSPNATCLDPSNAPTDVTCTCNTGYQGTGIGPNGCTDINECQGNPCGAGRGTCVEGPPGTYDCNCSAGYMEVGPTCVCDLNGTFAIRIETDQSWTDVFGIEDGSGTSYSWAIRRHNYTSDGTLEVETIQCNGTAPDLCGEGVAPVLPPEAYAQITTNQVWGSATMPVDTTTMALPNALPTADFITPRAASLLGIHLTNPLGAWPSANQNVGSGPGSPGTNVSYWLNHDNDANPAVTSYVVPPGGMVDNNSIPDPVVDYPATSSECDGLPYAWAPGAEGFSVRRIKRVYTASRVISELDGTIQSCNLITGDVTGPNGGEIQSDLRVHSCTRCVNGESSAGCSETACGAGMVDDLDNTSTAGLEIDGSTFRMERIDLSQAADDVEACEMVRDQLCFAQDACN